MNALMIEDTRQPREHKREHVCFCALCDESIFTDEAVTKIQCHGFRAMTMHADCYEKANRTDICEIFGMVIEEM